MSEASTFASDPHLSAWVAANAGAGKTYTLANRVARLLLADAQAGKNPLPHLHQGGGGGNAAPPVQAIGRMVDAARRCADRDRSARSARCPTICPRRGACSPRRWRRRAD